MVYRRRHWLFARVVNALTAALVRLGMSLRGAHLLTVPGRRSGRPQTVPVNPLDYAGERYLVAPRGETQWVRNLRAAGEAELRVGRRVERIRVVEVPPEERAPLLRAYLARWAPETQRFFGVGADASDDELRRIAPRHPVFRTVR